MTQTSTAQTITIKDPESPVTPNQAGFLAKLVKERDNAEAIGRYKLLTALGTLNKGTASGLIDDLLKSPKIGAAPVSFTYPDGSKGTTTAPVAAAFVPVTATPVAPKPVDLPRCPEFGYYDVDGVLFHWGVTSKDFGPMLRRLVTMTNYDGVKKGSWKKTYVGYANGVKTTATWLPFAGKKIGYNEKTVTIWAPQKLMGLHPMSLEQVKAKGKEFSFCIKCGALLTDPFSVANGIGPVCIKTIGL
jgi:hypothetical protein